MRERPREFREGVGWRDRAHRRAHGRVCPDRLNSMGAAGRLQADVSRKLALATFLRADHVNRVTRRACEVSCTRRKPSPHAACPGSPAVPRLQKCSLRTALPTPKELNQILGRARLRWLDGGREARMDGPTHRLQLKKRGVVWWPASKRRHRLNAPERDVGRAAMTDLKNRSSFGSNMNRSGRRQG